MKDNLEIAIGGFFKGMEDMINVLANKGTQMVNVNLLFVTTNC